MKRLLLSLLVTTLLSAPALVASEKANTVVLRPGETYYARFEEKGKKIKLLGAAREKDGQAQLVIALSAKGKDGIATLKIESTFRDDVIYKATIRSNVLKRHMALPVYPIVGGKMGTVEVPPLVDEVALSDFQFEPATLIEKEKADH